MSNPISVAPEFVRDVRKALLCVNREESVPDKIDRKLSEDFVCLAEIAGKVSPALASEVDSARRNLNTVRQSTDPRLPHVRRALAGLSKFNTLLSSGFLEACRRVEAA